MLAQVIVCAAPVAVGQGRPRFEPDSLIVVLDGPLVMSQLSVCGAPIDVGQCKLGVKTVYVYFSNGIGVHALSNPRRPAQLLGK